MSIHSLNQRETRTKNPTVAPIVVYIGDINAKARSACCTPRDDRAGSRFMFASAFRKWTYEPPALPESFRPRAFAGRHALLINSS